MASGPPTAGSRGAGMSPAEFEQALREATASLQSHGFGPRTPLIPDLRRALGHQVSREELDQGLRRLREEGSSTLCPARRRWAPLQDELERAVMGGTPQEVTEGGIRCPESVKGSESRSHSCCAAFGNQSGGTAACPRLFGSCFRFRLREPCTSFSAVGFGGLPAIF